MITATVPNAHASPHPTRPSRLTARSATATHVCPSHALRPSRIHDRRCTTERSVRRRAQPHAARSRNARARVFSSSLGAAAQELLTVRNLSALSFSSFVPARPSTPPPGYRMGQLMMTAANLAALACSLVGGLTRRTSEEQRPQQAASITYYSAGHKGRRARPASRRVRSTRRRSTDGEGRNDGTR